MTHEPSSFIRSLPKCELHLHLEGAIEPETLLELKRRHGMEAGEAEVARVYHDVYQYKDFSGFILAFKAVTEHLRTSEDFELVTYRMMQRLAAENVLHAEVYVSVGMYLWRGMDFDARFEGMDRGRAQGERDFGVSLLWIFDAVRHLDPSWGDRVAEKAARLRERNVVAIGIGGDERRGPAERFRNMYLFAREHGLRRTAHGGETTGPESIADALDLLGAERIGHGLSAWRDEALLERLVREQVPIEVCLTSNLRTGCCTSLEEHPLRRYYDAGVKVVLNTDDPAMFGTTLGREYQMAQDCFGFSDEELARLARNGFEASFLPEQKKAELAARVHAGEASAARVVGDRRGPRMNVEQQK